MSPLNKRRHVVNGYLSKYRVDYNLGPAHPERYPTKQGRRPGRVDGADTGSIFTARRGVERTLFWITIVLSVIFFALVITLLSLHNSIDLIRKAV